MGVKVKTKVPSAINSNMRRLLILLLVFLALFAGLEDWFFNAYFISFSPLYLRSGRFSASTAGYPSRLHASGSQILDAAGKPVLLQGLMSPDPAHLNTRRLFNQGFYTKMFSAGGNVIRIAVEPQNWQQDRDYLWHYLLPLVTWAGENHQYAIIDWHVIGNIDTGAGQMMPTPAASSKQVTLNFWRMVSHYFRSTPNVIFEIFNEPQGITASAWRQDAAEIISTIRGQGAGQLIIVGGIEFSRDLSWELDNPLPDPNLAFASHIYPAHQQAYWQIWFGLVSEKHPVLLTEWGFMDKAPDSSTTYMVGTVSSYARPLLQYLNAHHIGWVATWYDDEWLPPMFTKGLDSYTDFGQFVMSQLSARK